MANFRDVIVAGPSSPVGEATSMQDLVDLVESRISINEQQFLDEEEAAIVGGILGLFGAMIGGMMAGASAIEGPRITAALEAQSEALSGLQSAIESGDVGAMGRALSGLWGASVPADIEARAREIALEAANAVAEQNYLETGVLGDGAYGDNLLGDGFAYDYTLDLDQDYQDWANDTVTNENGDTSPRPVTRPDGLGNDSTGKPIIIDLDQDGIEININGSVSFDIDQDGFLERGNWVGPDDGFLVIDLNADGSRGNGDGEIDQARELAFSLWGNDGDTDLQALRRAFDDNNDDVLNSQDAVWSELRIWQDLDQDGETDSGELRTLSDWGITQINLTYDNGAAYSDTEDDLRIFDNTLSGSASYTRNGQTVAGGVGDVSLGYSSVGWRRIDDQYGYLIEFESGQQLRFAELENYISSSLDLVSERFDGAEGDSRNNQIDARNHTLSVQISGGAGADAIYGGHMDDFLSGDAGADHLLGYGGNDHIFFDAQDTIVRGGSGYDTAIYTGTTGIAFDLQANEFEAAFGGSGNDVFHAGYAGYSVALYGGDGNDQLNASYTDDMLSGDGGNDIINARSGDDIVMGGAGADHLRGDGGDDLVLGGDGDDNLNGGTGDDMLFGGAGDDLFWGDVGDDYLEGGEGADTLRGGNGDDQVHGGGGRDVLEGQNGDDRLFGGDGHDTIHGGAGDDYAEGGAGNDVFHDSHGDDFYRGEEGNDTFSLTIYGGNNVVQGGLGTDTLILSGNADQWNWEYVQNGAQGVGQYFFWSGDSYVQVQDVERVQFSGTGNSTYWSHIEQQSSREFSLAYIASYNDLINAMGADWDDGSVHWQNYGQGENRDVDFNALQYLAANRDVYNAWGFDLAKAAEHYICWGRNEGRNTGDFDAEQYLRNYADIRAAYGTDLSAATMHYIRSGRAAGRTDNAVSGAMTDEQWSSWLQSNAGESSIVNLANVSATTEHEDTFYWANHLIETDPNATIYGWQGAANNIDGGSGNDQIVSDANGHWYYLGTRTATTGSNDTVNGGDGSDTIWAGMGSDLLNGGSGGDALLGENGNDVLNGGSGADLLRGGSGNDTLSGNDGSDVLEGGDGDDRLDGGNGGDILRGGNGHDLLNGNWGSDYLYGGSGNDTLNGGEGADNLDGDGGNDQLNGGAGSDAISGGDGADRLDGGIGDDRLEGDGGNDTLLAGAGNDYLIGGAGHDSMVGDIGQDALEGGDGNDTMSGQDDNDILIGGAGADRLYGGNENDILNGGTSGDTLDGGAGIDAVSYADATTGVYFSLDNANAANFTGEAAGDVFTGIENAYGTDFGDRMYGTHGHNVLWGASGGDQLYGRGGNDDLFGGEGNDILHGNSGIDRLEGGDGNDVLLGGTEADQLIGGAGIDRAQYSNATAAVHVDLQNASVNTGEAIGDTFDSIENLHGSRYNDDLRGDTGANVLWGWDGHDHLHGRNGNDDLRGGNGNDILWGGNGADRLDGGAGIDRAQYYSTDSSLIADLQFSQYNTGAAAGDTYVSIENLRGGNGNDNLRGDAGNNTIWGGSGNDHLHGRLGNDILVGHSGADHFNFNLGWDQDQINDFTDNVDTIVFRNFGLANAQDALSHATQSGNHVVFDFGGGDTLTVLNANLGALTDDILVY